MPPSDEPAAAKAGRRTWTRWIVGLAPFVAAALFLLFGAQAFGLGGEGAARRWLALSAGPFALPLVIAAFAVLAFAGVPQVALIAAAVAVFGPWTGGLYSWIGTLISATAGFWLGRIAAPRPAGDSAAGRMLALIARNGFAASALVRLAPFAPFVLINMAAGASRMTATAFIAGTGLGIVPKIVLTAAAGRLAGRLLAGGGPWPLAFFVAALAVWGGLSLLARRWLRGRG